MENVQSRIRPQGYLDDIAQNFSLLRNIFKAFRSDPHQFL